MTKQRRTSKAILISAAMVVTLLGAAGGARGDDDLHLELGGFIGWHFFSDKNTLGRVADVDMTGFNDTVIFGPRLGIGSRKAVFEGEFGLMPTKPHSGAPSLWVDTFRVDARWNFLDGPFRPFVLAGPGLIHVASSKDTAVVPHDKQGLLTIGTGALFEPSRRWGARLDLRTMMNSGVASHATAWDFEVLLGAYVNFDLTCRYDKAPAASSDSDGDGIPDASDKCPQQPETRNGYQDDDGCPDELPEAVRRFTGKIKDIEFDTGKETIRPSSHKVLDEAVAVLKLHPTIKMVIEGHTDNVGAPAFNMELSRKRAGAVRDYFISKGIAPDRLTAEGFGETRPIADNNTEAGRADNRRVEFRIGQ